MSAKNLKAGSALVVLCILVFIKAQGQTIPGAVGNSSSNKIWLKADEGILDAAANARVELWIDQSGNNFNAIQGSPGNRPTYQTAGLNGRSYLQFDRSSSIQYLELTSPGIRDLITFNHTTFIVGKANSGAIDNSANAYQAFLAISGYHSGIGVSGYPETNTAFMTHWVGVWHNGRPTRSHNKQRLSTKYVGSI